VIIRLKNNRIEGPPKSRHHLEYRGVTKEKELFKGSGEVRKFSKRGGPGSAKPKKVSKGDTNSPYITQRRWRTATTIAQKNRRGEINGRSGPRPRCLLLNLAESEKKRQT